MSSSIDHISLEEEDVNRKSGKHQHCAAVARCSRIPSRSKVNDRSSYGTADEDKQKTGILRFVLKPLNVCREGTGGELDVP